MLSLRRSQVPSGSFNALDLMINEILRRLEKPIDFSRRRAVHRIFRKCITFLNAVWYNHPPDRCDVFFVVVEPTHYNQLKPIASRFVDLGYKVLVGTNRLKLFRSLRNDGFNVHILDGIGRTVNGFDLNFDEFEGTEDLSEDVKTIVRAVVKSHKKDLLKFGRSIEMILKFAKPKYVFVGNDLTMEGRLAVYLSKFLNIRTGMVQHGVVARESTNKLHTVNDYFVFGHLTKEVLMADECQVDQIVVTGSPYLDDKWNLNSKEPEPLLSRHFHVRSGFLLVAMSGFGHRTSLNNYLSSIRWICRLINERASIDVVIKLHRKEKKTHYLEVAKACGIKKLHLVSFDDERFPKDIFAWLKGCGGVVTGTSMVALEAMVAGVPVFSVDPLGEFKDIPFIDKEAVIHLRTYGKFVEKIAARKGNVATSKFLESTFLRPNGTASASSRVCDFVTSMNG